MCQPGSAECPRRDLDHHADLDLPRVDPFFRGDEPERVARGLELGRRGDEREHDREATGILVGHLHPRAHERAELVAEQIRPAQAQPDPPEAERGILLGFALHEGQRLVGTGVQGPEHDPVIREPPEDLRVDLGLLLDGRCVRAAQEQELGSHQAAPLSARLDRRGDVVDRADVRRELDAVPVGGPAGLVAERAEGVATPLLLLVTTSDRLTLGRVGIHDRLAGPSVDRDVDADMYGREQSRTRDHGGNSERPGQDRGVAGRRPRLGRDPGDQIDRDAGGLRGRELVRHDHGAAVGLVSGGAQPDEDLHHAVSDVIEVGRAGGQVFARRCDQQLPERFEGVDDCSLGRGSPCHRLLG